MLKSLRTLRTIPRIKDIAFVLARHGFHQVAAYLQGPVTIRFRRLFRSSATAEASHDEPERLRLLLQDLGPTFIKFGQLLSARPDLVPDRYVVELVKLQDRVRPSPVREIREVITEDFGGEVEDFFREFDPQPLATASIGQVHRAVTRQGDEVVVKVRRRGIARVVEQDIRVLHLLADILREWDLFKVHDLQGLLRLFERAIRRELDFTHERFNLLKMRQKLRPADEVRIPRVHSELCSKRVLTMEYFPGKKLTAVQPDDLSAGRGEALARRLSVAVIRQIFEDGVFHADLHPGNLILMPDGQIGLIDFGNIGRCTAGMMDDLVLLIFYLIRRDYAQTARMVLRVGRVESDVDVQELTYDLMEALDPYYGVSMRDIDIGGLLQSFFDISIRYEVTLPPQYVLLARTLIALEGVVRGLAPGHEILSLVEPALLKVVRSRWSPSRILRDLESSVGEVLSSLRSAPIHFAEVLKRTAEGRLKFETTLRNTERLEKRLELIGHRLPMALLAGATLLGSSILLAQRTAGETPEVQVWLGVTGFVASLLLVFWMAIRS